MKVIHKVVLSNVTPTDNLLYNSYFKNAIIELHVLDVLSIYLLYVILKVLQQNPTTKTWLPTIKSNKFMIFFNGNLNADKVSCEDWYISWT